MAYFFEIIGVAWANLLLHKLRSLLTALGIICGVAAVILMVAIGQGNKLKALADIAQMGATNIILKSIKPPVTNSTANGSNQNVPAFGLKRLDYRRIAATVGPIEKMVPLKKVSTRVSNKHYQSPCAVFGTTPALLEVASLRVARGRYLTEDDQLHMANVAVLGDAVAQRLFAMQDPLQGSIRFRSQVFRVVGVLKPVGLAGGAGSALVGRDLNFDVHVPLSAAQVRFGDQMAEVASGTFAAQRVQLSHIYIRVASEDFVMPVARQIQLLIDRDHQKKGDVAVTIPLELLEQRERTLHMFNYMMTAIAAISLLVGGIGIMNIMLATVTERTREIGIRRAIGATRRDIIMQFLIETTLLSSAGGLIGVLLGLLSIPTIAWIITHFKDRFADMGVPIVTQWSIVVSFLVATTIGIVFGIYPAMKAASQDPIVALRHD